MKTNDIKIKSYLKRIIIVMAIAIVPQILIDTANADAYITWCNAQAQVWQCYADPATTSSEDGVPIIEGHYTSDNWYSHRVTPDYAVYTFRNRDAWKEVLSVDRRNDTVVQWHWLGGANQEWEEACDLGGCNTYILFPQDHLGGCMVGHFYQNPITVEKGRCIGGTSGSGWE